MTEELYIIVNGQRKKLDLNSPSGITLEYKSNLFGDLSKIEASHSYTFYLPTTSQNSALLKAIDDIRTIENKNRNYPAQYALNGITIINDATLYVSECSESNMSCVFTWNVVKGLKTISSNDISIRELKGDMYHDDVYEEDDDLVHIGLNKFTKYKDYTPHMRAVKPIYNAGVDSYETYWECAAFDNKDNLKIRRANSDMEISTVEFEPQMSDLYASYAPLFANMDNDAWLRAHAFTKVMLIPPPAVPVRRLLDKIGERYGLAFNIDSEVLDSLCVPLTSMKTSSGLSRKTYTRFGIIQKKFGLPDEEWEVEYSCDYVDDYAEPISTEGWDGNDYINPEGRFNPIVYTKESLNYNHLISRQLIQGDQSLKYRIEGAFVMASTWVEALFNEGDPPKMCIQARIVLMDTQNGNSLFSSWVEVATLSGELFNPVTIIGWDGKPFSPVGITSEDDKYRVYARFNFAPELGGKPIDFDVNIVKGDFNEPEPSGTAKRYIELRIARANYTDNWYLVILPYEPYLEIADVKFMKIYELHEAGETRCDINVFNNLPDISCLEFIKSVYWAAGIVPYAENESTIAAIGYDELLKNASNNSVNWSNKCVCPSNYKISLGAHNVVSDLARRNYILMKNEEVKTTGQEIKNKNGEIWFEKKYSHFDIDSQELENHKVIYTFPFYGDYLHNADVQGDDGHNTMHFWETKNRYNYSANNAEPIIAKIGRLQAMKENNDATDMQLTEDYVTITTWQPDSNALNDPSLCCMAAILQEAKMVTEYFILNETDLLNIDFSKPIYLEKYNSYFAIIKVVFNTKSGIAETTMIQINTCFFDIICEKNLTAGNETTYKLKSDKNVKHKIGVTIKCLNGGHFGETETLTIETGNKQSPETEGFDDNVDVEIISVSCGDSTSNTNCLYYDGNIYRVRIGYNSNN